jgi:hypothetical protein
VKRTPLIAKPPVDRRSEPGRAAWKSPVWGSCQACGRHGLLLRHHVLTESKVRQAGGSPYDLRNAIQLGYYACRCHRDHHHAVRRIPRSCVPDVAVEFAVELLGRDGAQSFFERHYS